VPHRAPVFALAWVRTGQRRLPGSALASSALIASRVVVGGVRVVSHTVSQRTREIGVRFALAHQRDVRQSVLLHGNVMALGALRSGGNQGDASGAWTGATFQATNGTWAIWLAVLVLFRDDAAGSYVPARARDAHYPVEALRAE